jgi:hypothetical protein
MSERDRERERGREEIEEQRKRDKKERKENKDVLPQINTCNRENTSDGFRH